MYSMKNALIFFGLPGSGKGTQSVLLNNYLKESNNSVLLDLGKSLREKVKNERENSTVFREINSIMDNGMLVPTVVPIWFFFEWFNKNYEKNDYFLIDGSSRKKLEGCLIHEMLTEFKLDKIQVIFLDIPEEEVFKRLLSRGRKDDKEDVIQSRIQIFKNMGEGTLASVDFFEKQPNVIFTKIDGTGTIEEVFERVKNSIL